MLLAERGLLERGRARRHRHQQRGAATRAQRAASRRRALRATYPRSLALAGRRRARRSCRRPPAARTPSTGGASTSWTERRSRRWAVRRDPLPQRAHLLRRRRPRAGWSTGWRGALAAGRSAVRRRLRVPAALRHLARCEEHGGVSCTGRRHDARQRRSAYWSSTTPRSRARCCARRCPAAPEHRGGRHRARRPRGARADRRAQARRRDAGSGDAEPRRAGRAARAAAHAAPRGWSS